MKRAKTVMIQGTASSVGKSLMVAALCRIFRDEGFSVAPFKSQNMALNSYVTPDGREIGRAQAVQAEAARIEPSVEMNPILLKPEPEMRSQVVVLGKPVGSMHWSQYSAMMPALKETIRDCLESLLARYDLVVIEGAGSPAEINLRRNDMVNMHVAKIAGAPVILIGDIDRGGVFAQLVGTMELLEADDRARVKGFLINKFRGEVALLKDGTDFLAKRCGIPVLGVVPWIDRLRIADEDSAPLQEREQRSRSSSSLYLAVVKLPFISNYDDFLALEHEPGVDLRYMDIASEVENADLVIIPGTKSTMSDLAWMRRQGFADSIGRLARRGGLVLGICGGCQMLGEAIEDPYGIESHEPYATGLGLLPLRTRFKRRKSTARVIARPNPGWFGSKENAADVSGYEIHMGSVTPTDSDAPAFTVISRNGEYARYADGAVSSSGNVVGTMLHGIFEEGSFRTAVLDELRRRKGLAASNGVIAGRDAEYDRLAQTVRANVDMRTLRNIIGI
ncbi:MAG TPA: cobyric acid synthase [Candidatus Binataceae bacterium]|nr:cobyric acid synthase [Candidatus Binataceae bacterium]